MSLVGPRAIVPEELVEYGDYGRMLLRVKPGLTGLWQVSGRSLISYPERARIDLRYVHGRTLRQDIRLVLLRVRPSRPWKRSLNVHFFDRGQRFGVVR